MIAFMIAFLDTAYYVISFVNGLLFYQILKVLLPMRGPAVLRFLAYAPCFIIVNMIIYLNDIENYTLTFLFFVLFIMILYKGSTIIKLSTVVIFYPLIAAVNFLNQDIGYQIFLLLPKRTDDLYSTITHTACYVPVALIWFAVWRLSVRRFQNIMELLDTRMWLMLDSVYAVLLIGLFMSLNYLTNPLHAYLFAFAVLVTVFGSLFLISYIAKSVKTSYQLNALKMEYQYYEDKLKDEERVRAVYHDMKNHLLLLKAEDSSRNAEIIDSIQEQLTSYENYYQTGNTLLDVIIREKAELAREYQIDFSAMLRFESGDFMEPIDISTIFGNALDNAIEASLKLPASQRVIVMKAGRVHDMISIKIENHIAAGVKPDMKSMKKDQFFHGLGYKSIKQAVAKYGGQCTCKFEEERFTLTIIIPLAG